MGMPVTTPKTKLMANAAPELGGAVPHLAAVAQRDRLQHHDEQAQPHGELRKEVMKRDGKGKVQPVNQFSGHLDS
jgi:hypothetical protein